MRVYKNVNISPKHTEKRNNALFQHTSHAVYIYIENDLSTTHIIKNMDAIDDKELETLILAELEKRVKQLREVKEV